MPKIFLIRQGLEEQHELLAGLNRSKPGPDLLSEPDIFNHQEEVEVWKGKRLLIKSMDYGLGRKIDKWCKWSIILYCLLFPFL